MCRAAADRAAEPELQDRGASPALGSETLERRLAPAVAVVAVEPEGVSVGDQVGDGVQVDRMHVRTGIPEPESDHDVRQRYAADHTQDAHDRGSGDEPAERGVDELDELDGMDDHVHVHQPPGVER